MRVRYLLGPASLLVAALALAGCGSSGPGPTAIIGQHHITYRVDVANGKQAGRVEIDYDDDQVNNVFKGVTSADGKWPWTKEYDVVNPEGIYTDVKVDNSDDAGATLLCAISVDGQVQVTKLIAPGDSGECHLVSL